MRFAGDPARLIVAGGSPGEFGTIEVYDLAARARVQTIRSLGRYAFRA